MRHALEELGVTFVKLGQIISTRADLLPPEYQSELAKLQDHVAPLPIETVRTVIEAELGKPLAEAFASFDPVPLAAASIGQVHAATLSDGTAVVVKVRRPGVVEQVEEDLAILRDLASASRRWEFVREYDVGGLVLEFSETLRSELDYQREASNAERFRELFAGNTDIHIPRVYRRVSTSSVLTLERIHGIKIDELDSLTAAGIDRAALASRAARLTLDMVFEHGFFHADPHPGNFFVEPDGRIGLIDFGMVGTVDDVTQEQLGHVLLGVTTHDTVRLTDALLDLGVVQGFVDRAQLRRDLDHLLRRYYDVRLDEIRFATVLNDALGVVRLHRLQLPARLALLLKTVAMYEGLGVHLDPSFRLTTLLEPYAAKLLVRWLSPARWRRVLVNTAEDTARLSAEAPARVRRILADIERGGLEFGVRPEHFDPLLHRLERLVNRLVLGMLAAAFVSGLAVLMATYWLTEQAAWIGPLFLLGALAAAVLCGYLTWAILRSGRA